MFHIELGPNFRGSTSIHSSNNLQSLHWNLGKIIFAITTILMIQSGHNFAHVTTAQLSWHLQHWDQIRSQFSIQDWHAAFRYLNNELINCLWSSPHQMPHYSKPCYKLLGGFLWKLRWLLWLQQPWTTTHGTSPGPHGGNTEITVDWHFFPLPWKYCLSTKYFSTWKMPK